MHQVSVSLELLLMLYHFPARRPVRALGLKNGVLDVLVAFSYGHCFFLLLDIVQASRSLLLEPRTTRWSLVLNSEEQLEVLLRDPVLLPLPLLSLLLLMQIGLLLRLWVQTLKVRYRRHRILY